MIDAPRASLLLVDDKEENLLALRAILEPLDQDLVSVRSGEEALRQLLVRDFAVILLDVQMPQLDGFETAELIKRRERTRHIPIIFLTAVGKDERAVFRGYSSGAVDYMFKPFDPDILRSKVSVFIELWRKTELLKRQEELLREQELTALRAKSEERYRELADAMPQIVWTSSPSGAFMSTTHQSATSCTASSATARSVTRWSSDVASAVLASTRNRCASSTRLCASMSVAVPTHNSVSPSPPWIGTARPRCHLYVPSAARKRYSTSNTSPLASVACRSEITRGRSSGCTTFRQSYAPAARSGSRPVYSNQRRL